MDYFEKQISSKTVFTGKIVTLQVDEAELVNGSRVTREVIRHSGGVCVLALDGEDNVLFVRQFRYPYAENLLELPAGKLEKGEQPRDCGIRELKEETGCVAESFDFLAEAYPTPGYTDERLYVFTAARLRCGEQRLDEDEFLTVEKIPFQKAVEMCLNGEIRDAKTVIGILMYHTKRLGAR